MSLKTDKQRIAKSFTFTWTELEILAAVRREEGLNSDSAALRRLLQDGKRYRDLLHEAQRDIMKKILSASQGAGDREN